MSRMFHLYFRFKRPLTMGVRAMAFDAAGHLFLVRHTYVPGWHLPGGGIEPGETALQSLEREIREEGNLVITRPPRLHGLYFNSAGSNRDHVALYVLEAVIQTEPKRPDNEIAEAGFFPLNALPEETTPATRRRINEVLATFPHDPVW